MEAIKISVEVNVNLSENTQNFIKSLFSGACQCASQKPAATPAPSAPAAPAAPTKPEEPKKPSAPAAAPAPTKPAATPAVADPAAPVAPAPATPAAPSATSKTIEDVRAELAKKVNDHRDKIKDKLTELGAPSVTKLDPSKYDEMYNFLAAL